MLYLYRSLIVSRLLYSLRLVFIASRQWELLDTFHCVTLRFCLDLPPYSPNIPTLVEAEGLPLCLQAEERAMRHLERLHRAP